MKPVRSLFVLLLVCCTAPLAARTVVTGTLTGADGSPMTKAHVHIAASKYEGALQTVEVDRDGRYRIVLDSHLPFFFVQYTGASHRMEMIPLLVEPDKTVNIDVRLAPNTRPDRLDAVTLIGDFNDFDFSSGKAMTRQADGTFTAEVQTDAKTLAYQVIMAGDDPTAMRSINGTMHDELVYDGGGDYRSVVSVRNGKAHIVFDPGTLATGQKDAVVEFGPDSRQYAGFARLAQEAGARSSRMQMMAMTARNEEQQKAVRAMFKSEVDSLKQRVAREKDPVVRRALLLFALDLLQMTTLSKEEPQPIVEQAFAEIDPDSPLWSYNPHLLASAYYLADSAAGYRYTYAAFERHGDPKVRLAMLNMLMSNAFYGDRKEEGKKYYTMMMKEFPESPEAENARKNFDPERAIQPGRPVPDFSLASIDGTETLSRTGMKGRYYLIDFWATWCGPCVGEMGHLHDVYEKYRDKNFEIISLSFDGSADDVAKFRGKKWTMPWKHIFLKGGFESDAAKAFEVAGIPKPVLVGPDGTIVATEMELRGERLAQTLEKYLGAGTQSVKR